MKEIRYWTSHPNVPAEFWRRTFELDETRFRLTYDAGRPDYLFVTPHVYTNDAMRNAFARLYSEARVSIFYTTECAFPGMNLFDYAVTFSRGIELGGRVIRRSTRSFDWQCAQLEAERKIPDKSRFCNFIYSNSHAHPHRDWIFYTLSKYKRVDALGMHLNNCGNRPSRLADDWRKLAIEQRMPYRFSIAAENAVYPGYTSEKILLSFMAHTVPIYWGDPEIALEFNERAFVNANGLSAEELIERVRELDTDDDKYRAMLAEPPMTAEQCLEADEQERRYRAFTNDVFAVSPAEAKRAPKGTWNDNYKRWALAPVSECSDTILRMGRYSVIRKQNHDTLGPPVWECAKKQ